MKIPNIKLGGSVKAGSDVYMSQKGIDIKGNLIRLVSSWGYRDVAAISLAPPSSGSLVEPKA